MRWYWWALIVVGAVAVGWLKVSVFNRWMQNRKERNKPIDEQE